MHTLRNLVVGTDFTASSDAALDLAIALARVGSATITLVHVCADDVRPHCANALLAQSTQAGIPIMPVLRSGQIADKLNNVATEVGASLIIVGRTERGRIGSVAHGVLRTASRPVLVAGTNPLAVKKRHTE